MPTSMPAGAGLTIPAPTVTLVRRSIKISPPVTGFADTGSSSKVRQRSAPPGRCRSSGRDPITLGQVVNIDLVADSVDASAGLLAGDFDVVALASGSGCSPSTPRRCWRSVPPRGLRVNQQVAATDVDFIFQHKGNFAGGGFLQVSSSKVTIRATRSIRRPDGSTFRRWPTCTVPSGRRPCRRSRGNQGSDG